MSPQDKAPKKGKGKTREVTTAGPSDQAQPEEQRSANSGDMSNLDLNEPSAIPNLEAADRSITNWLRNTQNSSRSGSPPKQNQENTLPSADTYAGFVDEFAREFRELVNRRFSLNKKTGTLAPNNTPQPDSCNGNRGRSHSAGESQGRPFRHPGRTKSCGNSDLPERNSGASGLQADHGSSNTTLVPTGSMARPSRPQPGLTTGPAASRFSTPSDESRVDRLQLLRNTLSFHGGLSSSEVQAITDYAAGNISTLSFSSRPPIPPVLPGSTVTASGLAQPPSARSFQGQDAHNLRPAHMRPATSSAQALPAESEWGAHHPGLPPFPEPSASGNQPSPQTSRGSGRLSSQRPVSRRQRIRQDLRQLWRDCFHRRVDRQAIADTGLDGSYSVEHGAEVSPNGPQGGLSARSVLKPREGRNTRPALTSMESALAISGVSSSNIHPNNDEPPPIQQHFPHSLDGLVEGDETPPTGGLTLSQRSSATLLHAASDHSDRPRVGFLKRLGRKMKKMYGTHPTPHFGPA